MTSRSASQQSSQTLCSSSSPQSRSSFGLDLSKLPPIFVSLTHLNASEADQLEEELREHGATISYDPTEIRLVLSKVKQRRRAQFDLRAHGLRTQEVPPNVEIDKTARATPAQDAFSDSSTESEGEELRPRKPKAIVDPLLTFLNSPTIKVIQTEWLQHSVAQETLLPVADYLTYEGTKILNPSDEASQRPKTPPKRKREVSFGIRKPESASPEGILARAHEDARETAPRRQRDFGARRFNEKPGVPNPAPYAAGAHSSQHPPPLLIETTSEHDATIPDSELPPLPLWVLENKHYACQRPTPAETPNDTFLSLLKEIRLARLLTADEIGVRAYSTSIASIASYPYLLQSAREILRLPGCDTKIATLFAEFLGTGTLLAAASARLDPTLTILRLFFEIWGVGATTARDFHLTRGWRDLDDVVEFGWSTLSRVQQIGVKFYTEFQLPIPRDEVARIAARVHEHAVRARPHHAPQGMQYVIVGGYRRGKASSGDVDVLLSHPDPGATLDLVEDVVRSLEDEGCITHTLLLSLTSSHRGQETLPFRAVGDAKRSGFDTLDKALVVWRDPEGGEEAPHRRVDIIVSPWRTVGCAVAGWSGGTTFQRDLRRYAKNEKGWKFDSSGVRDRGTGKVVDVEGFHGRNGSLVADDGRGVQGLNRWDGMAMTMEEAERRVFEGMGLPWIKPEDRCTG